MVVLTISSLTALETRADSGKGSARVPYCPSERRQVNLLLPFVASIFRYHPEMPECGLNGGFLFMRDIHVFRHRLKLGSLHDDAVFPFDQGDVQIGDRQAVFLQHPCLDFRVRGGLAELEALDAGPRFVVQIDIDFFVLMVFAYGKYRLWYAGPLLLRLYVGHLHPYHGQDAAGSRKEGRQFHGDDNLESIRKNFFY